MTSAQEALPADPGTSRAPIGRVPWHRRDPQRPWSRATHVLLHATGLALAAFTFFSVLSMADMAYHPARDLELRATYDAYLETGVPLVKENGTGSWYGGLPGEGLTKAAGDDDPGSYLIASWMSHLTGSTSPYPGLRVAMALLAALPMLILPMTMARVFGRARAGMAMVLLPAVTWLVNGTVLTGTEYGLSDKVSTTPVYALYGLPASMVFLSLVLVAAAVARRPGVRAALGWTLLLVVLAACSNLMRSLSGVGIALAVAVVWWVAWSGRLRWLVAAGAAVVSLAAAMWLPGVAMDVLNDTRDEVVLVEASRMTDSHGKWHNPYLGLSWPTPVTGEPSAFGVQWSDEFGWNKAREVDPDVVVGSAEYDAIMKDLFLAEVETAPVAAIRLYVDKSVFILKHFAATLLVIALGAVLVWRRSPAHRAVVRRLGAASLPTLLLGLVPTVLVMPMLYYFTELAAGLGFLLALAVGGLGWTLSTLGSAVRVDERERARLRRGAGADPVAPAGLSLVLAVDAASPPSVSGPVSAVAGTLSADDEVILVHDGSEDASAGVDTVRRSWSHPASLVVLAGETGVGNLLRTGVLASRRGQVLGVHVADERLSGPDDFVDVPQDAMVAVTSRPHPRGVASRLAGWLRTALLGASVTDRVDAVRVDGAWARAFAAASRETGPSWLAELVVAAEQQGLTVWEVPVVDGDRTDAGEIDSLRAAVRLALRKDDYRDQSWTGERRGPADVVLPGRHPIP